MQLETLRMSFLKMSPEKAHTSWFLKYKDDKIAKANPSNQTKKYFILINKNWKKAADWVKLYFFGGIWVMCAANVQKKKVFWAVIIWVLLFRRGVQFAWAKILGRRKRCTKRKKKAEIIFPELKSPP